jgi:hypothetical protein
MADLLTYAKFHSREDARPLAELLQDASIPFTIEVERNQLDNIYIGETLDAMVALKIPGPYFQKANELVRAYTGDNSFPAKDEVHIHERLKKGSIIAGYVFSILIGFVGIFWGLSVLTSKKALKDGTRVSIYDEYSKNHARVILGIGIINLYLFVTGRIASWVEVGFNPF